MSCSLTAGSAKGVSTEGVAAAPGTLGVGGVPASTAGAEVSGGVEGSVSACANETTGRIARANASARGSLIMNPLEGLDSGGKSTLRIKRPVINRCERELPSAIGLSQQRRAA